ncbi:head-tail connector protein [Chitinasiproducens palmae]|uniref:Phage gp6-like head-tail connector protein n=1 Tax=Chitinasiproducens palmae TaxID=1770053 RepID=A0A1H2PSB4_9BURK|nr:head-tail connector protein [Chitinasiproducens palmae]SDV49816.1 Phage gp6-like head-tail connector protein [Chitinasiproducens palmae]
MTTAIIPADLALSHLRADAGTEDALIDLYLGAAVEHAEQFLNRRLYATTDDMAEAVLAGTAGDDPIIVNNAIRAAILLILGKLYANREDVVVGATVSQLPDGAEHLLQPYRVGLGV